MVHIHFNVVDTLLVFLITCVSSIQMDSIIIIIVQ